VNANGNLLLIVARAPILGTTKTRLAATIGAAPAHDLFCAFLADLARRFTPRAADGYDVGWACTPPDFEFSGALARFTGARPDEATIFLGQEGNSLNERLTNLFRWGFVRGYRRVAIMASDSPQLPLETAAAAFAALSTHDATIGRVADGGYYLIGLARFSVLLLGLPMSTTAAADAVVQRCTELGLRLREIAPSFDVDEADDLRLLRAALAPDGVAAPATWDALRRLGLTEFGLPAGAVGVRETPVADN
jgi:glycosyltransferase A (GT-A) superfamily protein (DUF2064 family)